jgi:dTMP kinase
VRRTFAALAEAEPDRYLVLDATRPPDDVAAAIRARVGTLLAGLPLQTLSEDDAGGRQRRGAPSRQAHR